MSRPGSSKFDISAEAWRVVKHVRDELVGRRREPTDTDWVEAIEAVFGRFDPDERKDNTYDDGYDEGYDEGYDDAIAEIEDRRRKLRPGKKAERAKARDAALNKAAGP